MVSTVAVHSMLHSSGLGPKKEAASDPIDEAIQTIADKRFKGAPHSPSVCESHQVPAGLSTNVDGTFVQIKLVHQILKTEDHMAAADMSRTREEHIGNGGASLLYAVGGMAKTHHGAKQAVEAHRHGDGLNLARRATESLQGTAQATVGLVQTASKVIGASPITGLQKVTGILGIVSKVGLAGMLAIFTIATALQFAKLKSVYNSVKEHLKDLVNKSPAQKIEAFKALSNTLVVASDDRKKVFSDIFSAREPWYKKSTANIVAEKYFPGDKDKKKLLENLFTHPAGAVDTTLSAFNVEINDADIELSPEEEADFNAMASLPDAHPALQWFPKLAKLLYKTGIENEAERKHTVFRDSFGINALLAVEQFNKDNQNIDACVETQAKIEEITTILSAAKTSITKNLVISFLTLVGMTVGAVGLIVAYFTSGGVFALVELGVAAVAAAASIGYNIYRLYNVIRDKHISSEHKGLIVSSSIGSLLLTGITIGFAQLGSTLGSTIAITAAWILLGLYSAYVWIKTSSSTESKEEIPTSVRAAPLAESGYESGPPRTARLVEDPDESLLLES